MKERFMKFLKKVTVTTASAVSAATLLASSFAGFATVMQPVSVAAAPASSTSCPQNDVPKTNIIYCGLTGSDPVAMMQTFQSYYNAGNDKNSSNPSTHTDIKQVYDSVFRQVNGNSSQLSSVFDDGFWLMGTAYDASTSPVKDHTSVTVGKTVVATDLKITSRCPTMDPYCLPASNYPALTGSDGKAITNVHIRDGNWFFAKDGKGNFIHSLPVLVHENANHVADFVVEQECGNAIVFTPVVPKQSLVCTSLTLDQDKTNPALYHFTAVATEENQTNGKMFIDFGDKTNSPTVSVNQATTTLKADHTYSQAALQNTITINIAIGINGFTTPGGDCQKQIVPKNTTFACKQLAFTLGSSSDDHRTYSFQALTQGTETAKNYQFVFTNTDGTVVTTTAQASNANSHTYGFNLTNSAQSFTGKAYFVSTSTSGKVTDKNDVNCQFSFTVSGKLPSTGPASTMTIFAGASIIGVALHQFILRRKALSL